MKHLLLILSAIIFYSSLFAQPVVNGKELYHYVFPSFVQGTVRQKSGEVNKALLNYNSLTEEMIFDQSGQKMALDKLEFIDTVYMENKRFILVGKVFYELAANTPIALFIQHKSEIIPPGSNTGFGTTHTSAATNVTDLKALGMAYQLRLPDDYILTSNKVFWLKKGNNYYVLKDLKDVQNLFVEKAGAIKEFVKVNKINFRNAEDLTRLILFSN